MRIRLRTPEEEIKCGGITNHEFDTVGFLIPELKASLTICVKSSDDYWVRLDINKYNSNTKKWNNTCSVTIPCLEKDKGALLDRYAKIFKSLITKWENKIYVQSETTTSNSVYFSWTSGLYDDLSSFEFEVSEQEALENPSFRTMLKSVFKAIEENYPKLKEYFDRKWTLLEKGKIA